MARHVQLLLRLAPTEVTDLLAGIGGGHGLEVAGDRFAVSRYGQLIAEGHLGRKAGQGFYRYDAGRPSGVAASTHVRGPDEPASIDGAAIRTRILRAIDAEARIVAAEGVASEADIDLAMRLGANHPEGPFERIRAAEATS